jgi:hypothetical protein
MTETMQAFQIALDDHRRRTCGCKVKYPNYAEADRVAEWMGIKHRQKFNAYECEYCHGFHVGHRPRWMDQK